MGSVCSAPGIILEWYVQCADIKIASSTDREWESFNSFSMVSPPVYPSGPSEGVGYRRNLAVPGNADFYMTGPACVDDALNQCALTSKGTKGYTGFGGENGKSSSPSAPVVSSPIPTRPSSTSESMACIPIGDCGTHPWCTQAPYDEWCSSYSPVLCPSPFCKVDGSGSMPMPVPMPVPSPAPASRPAKRRCVPTLEGLYSDATLWQPTCDAQAQANVCAAPICMWEAVLVEATTRKHSFLG